MKKLMLALLVAAALFVAVSGSPVQAGEEKVNICHRPPGNPENVQNIWVGVSAVPTHLEHEDYVGACIPGFH